MDKILKFLQKLLKNCHKHIVWRISLLYIITFCIPLICASLLYYNYVQSSLNKERLSQLDMTAMQIKNMYNDNVNSLLSVGTTLTASSQFCNYLDSMYNRDLERIYNYVVYIKPLLEHVMLSNSLIKELKCYSFNPEFISPPYYFYSQWPDFEIPLSDVSKVINPKEGLWKMKEVNNTVSEVTLYQLIYNNNFSRAIGVVCIKIDPMQLMGDIESLYPNTKMMMRFSENVYALRNDQWILDNNDIQSALFIGDDDISISKTGFFGSTEILMRLSFIEIGCDLLLTQEYTLFANENTWLFYAPIVVFVLLFSSVLFVVLSSGVRRIIKFSHYLQEVDYNQLNKYHHRGRGDEVDQLVTSYNVMVDNINSLIYDMYKMTIKNYEAQFYALQAQIKPHFLLNTLENIRMMAQINNDKQTSKMIMKLGMIFKYNLTEGNFSTIEKELMHACNYIDLCKMRYGSKLSYEILGKDESLAVIRCPKNIIQPIVENSIKHGFKDKAELFHIQIRLEYKDSDLLVQIRDTGCGFSQEALLRLKKMFNDDCSIKNSLNSKKDNSIGLPNVNKRMVLFYGEKNELRIYNGEEGGAVCELLFKEHSVYKQHFDNGFTVH